MSLELSLSAGDQSYLVAIDTRLLGKTGELVRRDLDRGGETPRRCAVIVDDRLSAVASRTVISSLTNSAISATLISIPSGEQSKSLDQVALICDQMAETGLDRKSFVIGLGGGVTGDISGFVAAIFHRGIPHVQIPTTLLAMVDSSIGGKTGVNTASGKNLIGAVHHPALVIDDLEVLATLPPREFRQGFAEIIKHGVIADAEMFAMLKPLQPNDIEDLEELVARNIRIKAKIVQRDELDETGERAVLNFGHTVGHAIERAGEYGQFFHGEAIAIGMVAAAKISVKRAALPQADHNAIVNLLERFELPTRLPRDFPREKIFDALRFDKKFESGAVRFVVTSKIGSAHLTSDVTLDDIREAVAAL